MYPTKILISLYAHSNQGLHCTIIEFLDTVKNIDRDVLDKSVQMNRSR